MLHHHVQGFAALTLGVGVKQVALVCTRRVERCARTVFHFPVWLEVLDLHGYLRVGEQE